MKWRWNAEQPSARALVLRIFTNEVKLDVGANSASQQFCSAASTEYMLQRRSLSHDCWHRNGGNWNLARGDGVLSVLGHLRKISPAMDVTSSPMVALPQRVVDM